MSWAFPPYVAGLPSQGKLTPFEISGRTLSDRPHDSPIVRIEHFAFNVADPVATASWYCEHFNMRVIRHIPQPAQTHFLADETGSSVIEIYHNPPDQVPDYRAMNPLLLHLAFASESPTADLERLVSAGASLVEELHPPDGSHLVMLRDPWGLAIQLCKRATPLPMA